MSSLISSFKKSTILVKDTFPSRNIATNGQNLDVIRSLSFNLWPRAVVPKIKSANFSGSKKQFQGSAKEADYIVSI